MSQGDGSRKVNPPPDVIFAQKATAIVKAAGMDPRSIDLEKFRLNASLVFSRAYSAIYKEKLLTVLNENSSKEDKILNSQLVLDGLFTKTRNPVLLQLTGNDLFQGNHRAIGVLVGILFAEGQRLWLEKIKSVQELAPVAPAEESVEAEQNLQYQNARDELDRNEEEANELNDDDLEESNGYGGNEIRESLKTLHKMRSNPDMGAVDMERLLSRISFLEEQLQRKNNRKKHSAKKIKQKRVERRISEAILQDNEINQRGHGLFDDNSQDEANVHTTQSSPRSGTADRKEYKRDTSRSPTRRPVSSGAVGIAGGRRTRPTSAPSTSNRKLKSVRHPSNRLYSAALSKKEIEPEKPNNNTKNNEPKEIFDPSLHTYDWKSGRKILLSQAQVEYEERKRSKEAMGNILAISDNVVDALMGAGGTGGRDGSPTKAEYPSKSISGDVDKWLQRMRRERYGESKSTGKMEDLPLPEPRYFAAYQKLEDRDLIITIEHCYNCQHHNVTTRHKQEEYVNHSSTFLRVLAQIAHECGVCARVGVSRFKANVTPKCSTSDQDSRVGAFEIQVAYKQPNGKVVPMLLHSKLTTRRWPSKSVLEKRFRAFVAKAKVSTASGDSGDARSSNVHMATDSTEPYPVGLCNWALSPVANPGWSFALTEASSTAVVPATAGSSVPAAHGHASAPAASTAASSAVPAASIANVQWAFDLRELSDAPPKFAIGSTVRVQHLNYSQNCTERHALLAVVKEYADPSDPHASDVIVKPMYQAQEVKVPQRNCVNLSSYTDREVDYTPEQVPIELQVLILLAKRNNLIAWDFSGGNGHKETNGDICLSRKAFYTQIRKLSWATERKLAAKGKFLLAHPTTGEEVDVQLSYSEEVINWVFEVFKGEGNVSALEKMVIPPPKAPAKPAAASEKVDPTPRSEKASSSRSSADIPGSPAASARPEPATTSAKTSATAPSGSIAEQQSSQVSVTEVVKPTAEPETDEPGAPLAMEPSALTVDSAQLDAASHVTPEESTTQPAVEDQQPAEGAKAGDQEPELVAPAAGDESTPPADAPASSEAPTAKPETKKPSAAQPKRFSSADLVGAVDAALKTKIISALTYPGGEQNPDMSAMERMGILEQLSSAVFEEAVLESDERAELPQASFFALLERFGLRVLLNMQSFAETVLQKAQTSNTTPDKPVKVEAFMNWLQSGDSSKRRQASIAAHAEPANVEPATEADHEGLAPTGEVAESAPEAENQASARAAPSSRSARGDVQATEPPPEQPLTSQRSAKSESAGGPSPGTVPAPTVSAQPSARSITPAALASEGSAKNTGRETATSDKPSPRGELTARTGSMQSMTNPVASARSATSADDKEAQERKQEEYRLSLDYQPKELQINSIIIESDQLVHAHYDSVLVSLRIGSTEWLATSCMPREKGSKRRSYNVKWPELLISADTFRNDKAYVTVAISDSAVSSANPGVPSLATTTIGESANSIAIPLYLLMQPSFDVVKEVHVEPIVVQKIGGPPTSGAVKITIHGNARDPKGLRTARIMSMRPQDLMNIKFDPILPLDDAEDLFESDEESITSAPRSRGRKPGSIPESPQEMEDEELTRTLYPKASMAKMSMANASPHGNGAVNNVMSTVESVETL